MKTVVSVVLATLISCAPAFAAAQASSREQSLLSRCTEAQKHRIGRAAAALRALPDTTVVDGPALARVLSDAGLRDRNLPDLAFLVLTQATREMDDDMRQIVAQEQARAAAKKKMRDLVAAINSPGFNRQITSPPPSGPSGRPTLRETPTFGVPCGTLVEPSQDSQLVPTTDQLRRLEERRLQLVRLRDRSLDRRPPAGRR